MKMFMVTIFIFVAQLANAKTGICELYDHGTRAEFKEAGINNTGAEISTVYFAKANGSNAELEIFENRGRNDGNLRFILTGQFGNGESFRVEGKLSEIPYTSAIDLASVSTKPGATSKALVWCKNELNMK